jgi:uncharacterized membrane protein YagU involved in acid resistance
MRIGYSLRHIHDPVLSSLKMKGIRLLLFFFIVHVSFSMVFVAFMLRIGNRWSNIPVHIQQNTTLHSLFYLETALHVLGGTSTHHQERKQLYLQHLVFVTPLLLPAAIAAGSSNGLTNVHRL